MEDFSFSEKVRAIDFRKWSINYLNCDGQRWRIEDSSMEIKERSEYLDQEFFQSVTKKLSKVQKTFNEIKQATLTHRI